MTRLDGNVVLLDWLEQYNFMTDHDSAILTHAGSTTMIVTGENTAYNALSLLELGKHFDLIVASGGYYHANVIEQMNILLDNDAIWGANGFSASGMGSVSTGSNLLWNQASIHSTGQTSLESMPDEYLQAAQSLAGGSDSLPGGLLSNPAFAGLGHLNVLYIDGSLLSMQYIKQTNILGDNDQVAMYRDALTEGSDTDWSISTGSNNLVNVASITDGSGDSTVYAGGHIYSDALLYQAELISNDPLGAAAGSPPPLASEAVVFLADGMLDMDVDDGDSHIGAEAPDAVHVDVMQTVLA